MPVPKYRTSASKRNMRRSHHALKKPPSSVCGNCEAVHFPHCVCPSCGFYNGKQVMNTAVEQEAFGEDAELSAESK